MLFNREILGLCDDSFEGSIDESRIFKEAFFRNDHDFTTKRCLVTGVINFKCGQSNFGDMSFYSNSENSAITSQLESSIVKEDSRENSAPRCFTEERVLLVRGDCDGNGKRMKSSDDQLSYSRPYSEALLNSSAPSKGGVPGLYQPASPRVCHTVTCRLVESSNQVVTSSCYLLKRHAETNSRGNLGDRHVCKSKLHSFDGSDEQEVNARRAIASPISQESSATKLLITCPSVSVAKKSRSRRCAEERMKKSNFDELAVAKIPLDTDSVKDPRPLLRSNIQNLLRAAGWEIGRRKREDNIRGEYLYFPPRGGRPIREFRRVWNLCGQSLFADRNIDVQEHGKMWTDLTHFWDDLSTTLIKIEQELNTRETTAALAHWWYLLDPFAIVVFIDKKLGTLREGKVVKARRSLAANKVVTIGNQSERQSIDTLSGSSIARESPSTGFEGMDRIWNEKGGNGSSAYFRNSQRGAVKALKGVSNYLSEDKCMRSVDTVSGTGTRCRDFSGNKRSRQDPISLQACGSNVTFDQFNNSLFEVPITYENTNIIHGGSGPFLPCHDCNANSLSCDRLRSNCSEEMALEVNVDVSTDFFEGKTLYHCFGSQNVMRVMQHSGHNDSEKCFEASKSKMNAASSVADAILEKKAPKKLKMTSDRKLIMSYQNDRSTFNKTERRGISMNAIRLESVGVKDCYLATNGRADTSCEKSFISSSRHWKGKKASRLRKMHEYSGNSKTSNQFSYEDLKFANGTDKAPLHMKNDSVHPETQHDSRQKRSNTCRLKDDDLLISAIIKNKTLGSTSKQPTQKMKSCKSEALRKRKSQKGSCRLLPRSMGKGGKHVEGKWSIMGVRTVLSWLIDSGVVSLNEVIQYRSSKDDAVVKDGFITRDGILCKCCNEVLSVTGFKIHAGFRLKHPCLNLFMESGKPFTLCLLEAWSTEYKARKSATVQVVETDQNDDRCGLCGDGGELICCDNCPSTFHQACLYSQELPEGNWYCPYCTCRVCGGSGSDDKGPLKSPGGLKCSQCEHRYHEACLQERVTCREVASDHWFCSESCQEVYSGLHSCMGFSNVLSDGFSWTLLRCIHGGRRVHSAQRFVALKAECNSKLAVALTIMEECFVTMVDPRTGIDMIPHVLYNWGSEFTRLNYSGFYTMLLEKDDVLMSVASIRIHGATIAEMPLIATCGKYRRQGMCRRLMNALEELLRSFKVEKLVISAIPSLVETWMVGFGFEPMEDHERNSLRDINLMVFPGTIWLKKPIYRNPETDQQGSGHASPIITEDPAETGACSEEGPIPESRKQSGESSSATEVRIPSEPNTDVGETVQNRFSNLSCEEPASTLEESQVEKVYHVESVVMYDERILSSSEQQQKSPYVAR